MVRLGSEEVSPPPGVRGQYTLLALLLIDVETFNRSGNNYLSLTTS